MEMGKYKMYIRLKIVALNDVLESSLAFGSESPGHKIEQSQTSLVAFAILSTNLNFIAKLMCPKILDSSFQTENPF